jgi:serine-type D-Ala-D-Ala carboxypeptidase (penicillin-binding protein 5/6)
MQQQEKILYEKNMHVQHYPASTTKMITGILALENLNLADPVTIDAETPFTIGSRIYLLEGEEVTVEEVLYGLLLESANDAAVALAKEISGTVENFATK